MGPDYPQHDHTAVHVIAQQYSSAYFISSRFYSRKTKFYSRFKNVNFFFKNALSLK
jgi:hypothetical protein